MSELPRMHLSPSSFDTADPVRTLCGRRPLHGPFLFTEPERRVCQTCKKIDKGAHLFYFDGERWRIRRLQFWAGSNCWSTFGAYMNTTSSSSANTTVTWIWKHAA